MKTNVVDVQNEKPKNEIELEKVGIEGLKKYVIVKRPNQNYHVIIGVNSYITLPPTQRGAHMSRFVESVAEIPKETSSIEDLAKEISEN